jgi:hypothetical protein
LGRDFAEKAVGPGYWCFARLGLKTGLDNGTIVDSPYDAQLNLDRGVLRRPVVLFSWRRFGSDLELAAIAVR